MPKEAVADSLGNEGVDVVEGNEGVKEEVEEEPAGAREEEGKEEANCSAGKGDS